MNKEEIKPGIFWVGGIDWNLRNFHGYITQKGSTYNSYLIMDEKIVLVDTVKSYLFPEMMERIKAVADPEKIDLLVSNHVEMDHSGSLPMIKELLPNAKIVTSPQGKMGLERHFKSGWDYQVVRSGDSVNIGKRNLVFVQTPMVHWPDSMVTYIPEDNLLLPNDAFGQHIASTERYDRQMEWGMLKEEAAKYYANIVMPFGPQVKKALETVSSLKIDMIAPSHGIIWQSYIPDIIAEYSKWCENRTEKKALIVYDSMWGTTECIAKRLLSALQEAGIKVSFRDLKYNHISDIMTDVLTSRLILMGSPTLNNNYLPTMGALLTYLKGLRPKGRIGLAFGSYGWSGQAVKFISEEMKKMGWDVPLEGINIKFIPESGELDEVEEVGQKLIEMLND